MYYATAKDYLDGLKNKRSTIQRSINDYTDKATEAKNMGIYYDRIGQRVNSMKYFDSEYTYRICMESKSKELDTINKEIQNVLDLHPELSN